MTTLSIRRTPPVSVTKFHQPYWARQGIQLAFGGRVPYVTYHAVSAKLMWPPQAIQHCFILHPFKLRLYVSWLGYSKTLFKLTNKQPSMPPSYFMQFYPFRQRQFFFSRPRAAEGNSSNSHVLSIASPLSGFQPARPIYTPLLPIQAVCRKRCAYCRDIE